MSSAPIVALPLLSRSPIPVDSDWSIRIVPWLALALVLVAELPHVMDPWESGLRGINGAEFTATFVRHLLALSPADSHLAPIYFVAPTEPPHVEFDWHHPPLYPLLMTPLAWLFGEREAVFRMAHLVLFTPAMFALHRLLLRIANATLAGWATLFFVATPLGGYYGPMVIFDGVVLAFGLLSVLAFVDHIAAPSRASFAKLAVYYFLTTAWDYQGHFFGVALFLLAFHRGNWLRNMRTILALFAVSLLSLLLVAVHYGTFLGGVGGFFSAAWSLAGHDDNLPAAVKLNRYGIDAPVAYAARQLLWTGLTPLLPALALVGLCLIARRATQWPRPLLVVVALAVPGLLNCALFFGHALLHVYWSLIGLAGIATLAAIGPAWAMRSWVTTPGRLARGTRLVVLALAVGMLGHGVVTTHRLIAEHATDANRQLGATIRELATGADIVLCSEDLGVAIYYVGGFVVDGVSQETDLNLWVELVRAHAPGKRIAFFMDKARASEPIAARLRGLAAELPSDRWLVFHL